MKRIDIFLAVIGLLGLSACQQEVLQPEGEGALEPIRFRATAGAFQVKATDTAFELGDAIGLSVGRPVGVSNAMLQLTDDGLAPQETIYWAKNQTVASSFDAYYPYQDGVDFVSGFTFTVNPDQSTHALYTASDFMSAHTESAPADGVVDLKFTHRLSKLVLVIDNQLEEGIADVYVGNVQGRAKVEAGSAPVAAGLPGTIKAGAVKLSGIGPAYALVMAPQETSPKLMVTTVSGKQYTFVLPEAVSFVSGMRYLTHIAISADSTFSDFSVEVSEWTDNADIEFKSAFSEVIDGTDGQKYTVTGTIRQILNANYGNMLLESEGAVLYIYGLLTPDGKYPYQAGGLGGDAFNLAVGDQITVYGTREIVSERIALSESTLLDAVRSEVIPLGSIPEVIEAPCGPRYAFSGIVHAVSIRGFVLYDGVDAVLVYTGAVPSCSVGDKVEVIGVTTVYRGCIEVNIPKYTVISSDNELFDMTFEDITESLDDVVVAESRPVRLVGTLDIQGNDYLLTVDGASSQGNIYWPSRDLGLADLNGKEIRVEGFLLSKYATSSSIRYDIMATSVKENVVSNYLTFTSEGTTSISLGGSFGPILYYSTDRITWEEWNHSELTFSSDSPLYVCGDNPGGLNNAVRFETQGDNFAVSGSVMSLLDRYSELTAIPGSSAYCFGHLFAGCTGLTSAPELPATTLADACYVEMFSGCTSLTSAPELPATTLANECYWGMFSGCTGLTAATELPATTLANRCYLEMFYGCIGLISAPELPATTLAEECYFDMFSGCTSLTSAPELPAAALVKSCYSGMFGNCSGLISAPELPVTTLAEDCYTCMFYGCSGLTSAPELPATTLANSCYTGMFAGCTSLTIAPELPATSLEDYCYASMFENCTGLTAAPELPASTLADYCYMYMFSNCSNLNYVKCLATDISTSFCTGGWLSNVSTSGTFVKASGMNDWLVGESGIPQGWTVEEN